MRLFGRKAGRPVVPWGMPRLPEVPKRVRIAAWCAGALFAAAAAGVGIVALGCPPVSALRDYKPPQASLVFAEVPPRVDYEITPNARRLRPIFVEIVKWAEDNEQSA